MTYIASDHAGFSLKTQLIEFMKKSELEIEDLGPFMFEYSDDYVDYAIKVCEKVQKNSNDLGILICASGEGMMITANKFRNIYAAFCQTGKQAVLSKEHNNSNVLVLSNEQDAELVFKTIILPWLKTEFSNIQRHVRRIEKIKKLEDKFYK